MQEHFSSMIFCPNISYEVINFELNGNNFFLEIKRKASVSFRKSFQVIIVDTIAYDIPSKGDGFPSKEVAAKAVMLQARSSLF